MLAVAAATTLVLVLTERAAGERTRAPKPPPTTSGTPTTDRPAPRGRPNVVVVMADDMRVDELRFMPRVRRLVSRHGLRFENSFSPYPLCCPARASFLTGQHAHNHGVYWHEPPYGYGSFDDSRTLATSLQAAGYRNGFVGKYLNGYGAMPSRVTGEPSHTFVPPGWDDWRAAIENPGVDGVHGGTYSFFDIAFNVNGEIDNGYRGRYQTGVLGDFSVSMARRFAGEARPFFMYVNYVAPHAGMPVEPDDHTKLPDATGHPQDFKTPARPGWVKGRFDDVIDRGSGMPKGGGPSERDITDKPSALHDPEPTARERRELRNVTRQRAESVFVIDRHVGRLVRELRRSGEWRDTVFVFTSDNGFYLGEHRKRAGKVLGHEPSVRVPLLVTGPGLREGGRRNDPITTVDLTRTILDLAQARPPVRPDGTSLLQTIRDGDRGWTRPVLYEALSPEAGRPRSPGFTGDERGSIGVRTARFSYIRHRTGEHELYDLARDPRQLRNVYGRARYHTAQRQLRRVWWRLRNCTGTDCSTGLPGTLPAGPRRLARLTGRYWREIDRVYGW